MCVFVFVLSGYTPNHWDRLPRCILPTFSSLLCAFCAVRSRFTERPGIAKMPCYPGVLLQSYRADDPSSMIHCDISWNPEWSRTWHSLQIPPLPWPLSWYAVLGDFCSFRSWWMLSYCCVQSPDRWHTGKTTPLEQRLLFVRYPCILSVWGLAQSSQAYKVTSAGLRLFLQSLLFCMSSSKLEIW